MGGSAGLERSLQHQATHIQASDYPVSIVQFGEPRSASSFQWVLACLAMRLKYPAKNVKCDFNEEPLTRVNPYEVWKVHHVPQAPKNYTLIMSVAHLDTHAKVAQDALRPRLTQTLADMQRSPMLEVSKFTELLGLTPDDDEKMLSYMRWWEILRQCCGPQQSMQNVLQLRGCASNHPFDSASWSGCDVYNISQVEVNLRRTEVHDLIGGLSLLDGWDSNPNSCAPFEEKVRAGGVDVLEVGRIEPDTSCTELTERIAEAKEEFKDEFDEFYKSLGGASPTPDGAPTNSKRRGRAAHSKALVAESPPGGGPSVAIIVTGLLRTLNAPRFILNFRRAVLEPLRHADVFLALSDNPDGSTKPPNLEEVAQPFLEAVRSSKAGFLAWRRAGVVPPLAGDCDGDEGSWEEAMRPQWWTVSKGFEMMVEREKARGAEYDMVVRTRTDLVYTRAFPPPAALWSRLGPADVLVNALWRNGSDTMVMDMFAVMTRAQGAAAYLEGPVALYGCGANDASAERSWCESRFGRPRGSSICVLAHSLRNSCVDSMSTTLSMSGEMISWCPDPEGDGSKFAEGKLCFKRTGLETSPGESSRWYRPARSSVTTTFFKQIQDDADVLPEPADTYAKNASCDVDS